MDGQNRLPLFIGTQFGIYPAKAQIKEFKSYNGLYAVLGKSVLSGSVFGLSIYSKEGKIAFIPNKKFQGVCLADFDSNHFVPEQENYCMRINIGGKNIKFRVPIDFGTTVLPPHNTKRNDADAGTS